MTELLELSAIRLTVDVPAHGLIRGEIGTIVHVFHGPNLAYEVEFVNDDGSTKAEIALVPGQVEAVES